MALFAGGVLFGTGLGPMVSGFIAQNTSWRWVFGIDRRSYQKLRGTNH